MIRVCIIAWYLVLAWAGPQRACAESFHYPKAKHGKGELSYVNGIPVLQVAGTPEEMGEQMGVLALKPAASAIGLFEEFLKAQGLKNFKPLLARVGEGLLTKFPAEYRQELDAAAKAGGVDRDLLVIGNTFHDVRRLTGCSALMVGPNRSKTGGPLVGRNLDYDLLKGMHQYSLVVVYRPKDKRAFAVVSFPGAIVIGCAMSAMNADGLILGQNDVGQAADGSPPLDLKNTPTAVLARRILEECASLDEAKKLLDRNKPASRSIFIACDRRGGGAFEITPKTIVLRKDELCVATNHFESKQLAPSLSACPRAFLLAQASGLKKLGVEDVAKKMQEVHQGARTAHSMVFEPKPLKLHVAFGDGDKPANQYPLKEIDLSKMLRP
jgi:hypothetical protein